MKRIVLFCIVLMVSAMAESNEITLNIVYNNVAFDKKLTLSWGMACVIEGMEKVILFDTGGDGDILLANMKSMGIDPEDIDAVVLSHIHGDHTGGLASFLAANSDVTLYVPSSFPEDFKGRVKAKSARVIEVSASVEICDRVYTTGELGIGIKEQALVIKTEGGLVMVTGCAHPGVVHMVKRALELFDSDMYLVTGGFHLGSASENEIKKIITELKNYGVKKVGPSHCTGERAIKRFKEAWGKTFVDAGCGAVIKIPNEE
jgi:7,8-dihydropterin-6-yl-methyl-4-(beta-D-ribofuranosyl)aminobenzene 5'-phosphate synthase